MNEIKDEGSGDENQNGNIGVKLRFDSISNGKLKIQNLTVKYSRSAKSQQYPELICVVIIGIILIVIGLVIKFVKLPPRKTKKDK